MNEIPWRDLFTLVGLVVGGLAAVVCAGAYLLSRARKTSDMLRQEYIAQLIASRDELMRENKDLVEQISELRAEVRVLRGMILGRCIRFEHEPETGGCGHCDLGLAYGQRS